MTARRTAKKAVGKVQCEISLRQRFYFSVSKLRYTSQLEFYSRKIRQHLAIDQDGTGALKFETVPIQLLTFSQFLQVISGLFLFGSFDLTIHIQRNKTCMLYTRKRLLVIQRAQK